MEEAAISYSPGLHAPTAAVNSSSSWLASRSCVSTRACAKSSGCMPARRSVDAERAAPVRVVSPPEGDWLVVHVRPDYLSVAIMRGDKPDLLQNREGDRAIR
jgi:hypothetical protein